MKGILVTIACNFILTISFAQTPVARSSNAVTAVDQHIQVAQSLAIPAPYDTTAVNGLDSVGLIIYSRRYMGLYVRDTFPGGKKWTRMLKSGDAGTGVQTFNTRTGTVTLLFADVVAALGYTPPNPNGTNLQYIAGDGSKVTFPTIPAQFNPIQGYGILITGSYPNKTFVADTGTLFSALRATIPSGNIKWGITGNSGTVDGTNFLGTTDNVPLNFSVNSQPSGRITSNGNQTYYGYQAGNGANSIFTTAIGYQALLNNSGGNYSTAVGYQALQSNTSGLHNVGIGFRTLKLNTVSVNNVAVGDNSLLNLTGGSGENTAVGGSAFNNATTAQYGVAFGWDAAGSVTTGDSTTAIGSQSGFNITTGKLNTLLGTNTGEGIVSGSYNTILGANVIGLSPTLNNNIIISDGKGRIREKIDSFGTAIFNSITALGLPSGTTAQRPSSPSFGFFRGNQDSSKLEFYNGSAWVSLGASTGGGGSGTVTSVGTGIGLSGGPITGSGTIVFDTTYGGTLGGIHTRNYNDARYAPIGIVSGINQLTGDVTAGPGTGSQATTIVASAVTTGKINNNAVTYAKVQAATQQALLGATAAGNYQEITLGTGLTMTGSVLSATGTSAGGRVSRINFIESGNSSTYTNTSLINRYLLQVVIESTHIDSIAKGNAAYYTFNASTGAITITNGLFADSDNVEILYQDSAGGGGGSSGGLPTANKRAIFFGDSITDSLACNTVGGPCGSWADTASALMQLQLGKKTNFARFGAAIEGGGTQNSWKQQVDSVINTHPDTLSVDLIVVHLGTNDSGSPFALGNYDSAMSRTSLGALDTTKIFEMLRYGMWSLTKQFPGARCYWVTPIEKSTAEPNDYIWLYQAIQQMANRYNFKVINGLEVGVIREYENPGHVGRYLIDGTHPQQKGKGLMGHVISNRIITDFITTPYLY